MVSSSEVKNQHVLPRILVTGKDGQLGFELSRSLQSVGDVTTVGRAELDLTNPKAIQELIACLKPDFIVNAAAYTAVDKAESDSEQCFKVNAQAPGVMAEAARLCGATLVHFSTDYVFDGEAKSPYRESDECRPQSVYGASKLAGEQAVRQVAGRHFIFRTSWVVGIFGANFAKTMIRLARERDELRVVADQWGAPTPAYLLADITAAVLRSSTVDPSEAGQHGGTYHVAPLGSTTWHGYAQHVIRRMLELGAELRATPENILPIATAEFPTPAKRPSNSRLDTTKLRSLQGIALPTWEASLEPVIRVLAQK